MYKNEKNQMLVCNKLPKMPHIETEKKALEYIDLIFTGTEKTEAFKIVFPDRYERIANRAKDFRRGVRATLLCAVREYEDGKYVKSLYTVGNENYFTKFIDKRTRLLDKLYDIAMDEDENMSYRLNASKTFLSSIPEADKKIVVSHDVDVKVSFKQMLENKQKELYDIANSPEEIIDAELE